MTDGAPRPRLKSLDSGVLWLHPCALETIGLRVVPVWVLGIFEGFRFRVQGLGFRVEG